MQGRPVTSLHQFRLFSASNMSFLVSSTVSIADFTGATSFLSVVHDLENLDGRCLGVMEGDD